jgi:L-alanine-DL-glutamate epimerase-like enolase superfamily enzyme
MSRYDVVVTDCELFFQPIETRVPLKFGPEVTTHVVSARAHVFVVAKDGTQSDGWGETPLSVAWVWPGSLGYSYRQSRLQDFCVSLRDVWKHIAYSGHAMEIGHRFVHNELVSLWNEENEGYGEVEKMPWLAALVCDSLFDLALHDAYGKVHGVDSWETFNENYMNHDLAWFYDEQYRSLFEGKYPGDYLLGKDDLPGELVAWHLIGAKDIVARAGYDGEVLQDGYPFFLDEWVERDGLKCLKVKLTGTDGEWDYRRLIEVGMVVRAHGVSWLTADFNCTVTNPVYVTNILDRLMVEYPDLYAKILYVEQPFPYDIERHPIDVHSVSARKPLFMDESAHDWRYLAYGRKLGWTGVALKTCKTLSGALLSLCWAKEHGMTLMVQDLTNPMLAQIPHVVLAARAGTIMGVETNSMQFYPEASVNERRIHPGLFERKDGCVRLDTLGDVGLGYRYDEIEEARIASHAEDLWQRA